VNVRPAIAAGDRVSRTASSGSATWNTPSARFENADAAHSRRNGVPNRVIRCDDARGW
jgi:hypothetical protein